MRSWERVEDVRTERRWRDLGREDWLLDDDEFIFGMCGLWGCCGGLEEGSVDWGLLRLLEFVGMKDEEVDLVLEVLRFGKG